MAENPNTSPVIRPPGGEALVGTPDSRRVGPLGATNPPPVYYRPTRPNPLVSGSRQLPPLTHHRPAGPASLANGPQQPPRNHGSCHSHMRMSTLIPRTRTCTLRTPLPTHIRIITHPLNTRTLRALTLNPLILRRRGITTLTRALTRSRDRLAKDLNDSLL